MHKIYYNMNAYEVILMEIKDILGLVYELPEITKSDIENYNKWQEYRNKKDFENADIYRNKLIEKNII